MPTRLPTPPPPAPAALSYGPSLITDRQWYLTAKQVAHPPSCDRARLGSWREPITLGEERYARATAMQRIWNLRNMMSCPLVVISTSAILMHRFYMVKSVQDFPPEDVGSAVFFLANKVEENPINLRHIIGYCLAIERKIDREHIRFDAKGRPEYDPNDDLAQNISKRILYTEDAMLHALCFDLTVQSPFFAVVEGLKKVYKKDLEGRDQISFVAWQILQDVLATTLVIRYQAYELAAAAILCALAQLSLPIPRPISRPRESTRGTGEKHGDVEMLDGAEDTSKGGPEGEEGEEVEQDEDLCKVFEVTMDRMRGKGAVCLCFGQIVKLLAETWELGQDPYVVHEGRRLRKYVYRLLDIPHDSSMDQKPLPPEIPRVEPRRKQGSSTPRLAHPASGKTPNSHQQSGGYSTPGDNGPQFAPSQNQRHDTYGAHRPPHEPPSGQGLIPAPPPPPFPELYGTLPQQQGYSNQYNQNIQHHNNQQHNQPIHYPQQQHQQHFPQHTYPNQPNQANHFAPAPPFQPPQLSYGIQNPNQGPPHLNYGARNPMPTGPAAQRVGSGGFGSYPNPDDRFAPAAPPQAPPVQARFRPIGGGLPPTPSGPKFANTMEVSYDDRRRTQGGGGGWATSGTAGSALPPNLPYAASTLPPRPQLQAYDDVTIRSTSMGGAA
ncbi:BQ5605_C005g03684 [Microbotryum silenes-dioicae]|uniref:BQ5605_C005g03684 protein n=1 Tax=Microbotryum silenes-dioicae TaxID=796604 RepID=A0A2X0MYF7_9BASI|nr:BQ5605_C005g03684 [Microbotryum silenes-dioicae]